MEVKVKSFEIFFIYYKIHFTDTGQNRNRYHLVVISYLKPFAKKAMWPADGYMLSVFFFLLYLALAVGNTFDTAGL